MDVQLFSSMQLFVEPFQLFIVCGGMKTNQPYCFNFIYLSIHVGNLNDGPKNGDQKQNKPTAAPFQRQCMYNGILNLQK